MYGRMQEDVAWTRLQDMQREMENRRLFGRDGEAFRVGMIRSAGRFLGNAANSALQRVARRDPAPQLEPCDTARDVA